MENMKDNKKNKMGKWLKIGVAIVIVTVGGFAVITLSAKGTLPVMAYTEMSKGELVDSLSAKGAVESSEKRYIYTNLGFTIKHVNVEVGDHIEVGQMLAELDTENLELDIAARKADLSLSQQSSLKQLENNKRIYNESEANLNNGTNSQITNAESSLKAAEASLNTARTAYNNALKDNNNNSDSQVRTTEINLAAAQNNYDDALHDYENNLDVKVSNAESSLTNAQMDLDIKKKTYEDYKVLFEIEGVSQDELQRAEDAYIAAKNNYDNANISLENAKTSQMRTLEQMDSSLQTARTNYENAVKAQTRALEQAQNSLQSAETAYNNAASALDAARVNASQDLDRQKGTVEASQISTNADAQIIAIQKLEKQLNDSFIISPIRGTVTAVYAREGAAGSGLLFVVEDTENLKITTRIREYDIGRVKPGMTVSIRSDSTGDAIYKGKIAKIEPAAIKNASGDTNTASDIEFGAEVLVLEPSELRIGMAVRLTIEIEKKENVYKLAYDAVQMNEDGTGLIFVAEQDNANQYIARRMNVETSMETDFYVEIKGDGLSDGMKVLNDASVITEGMAVAIK